MEKKNYYFLRSVQNEILRNLKQNKKEITPKFVVNVKKKNPLKLFILFSRNLAAQCTSRITSKHDKCCPWRQLILHPPHNCRHN